MPRMRLRASGALLFGGWLMVSAASGTPARGADRPAEQILAEIEAVEIPKLDPDRRGETAAMTEYLTKRKAAMARRGDLILELLRGHPDHPSLPDLFTGRWRDQLGSSSSSLLDPKFIAELDEVMAKSRSDKLKADAAFYKTIVELQTGRGGPDEILKTVEKFIAIAPKDERGALLLFTIGNQMEGSPRQVELFKRVISDYPESSSVAGSAKGVLRKKEGVGKPFDLEFTDAIKGTSIAMKELRGKVVVIDFWATWCGPCVAEMPRMKELYAKYRGQGVEFIGVSLDESKEEGGLDQLKEFVARNEIKWPQYYQGKGWKSDFSSSWGIESIPAVFVVARDGTLFSTDARGRLDAIIPELLKNSPPEKAGD